MNFFTHIIKHVACAIVRIEYNNKGYVLNPNAGKEFILRYGEDKNLYIQSKSTTEQYWSEPQPIDSYPAFQANTGLSPAMNEQLFSRVNIPPTQASQNLPDATSINSSNPKVDTPMSEEVPKSNKTVYGYNKTVKDKVPESDKKDMKGDKDESGKKDDKDEDEDEDEEEDSESGKESSTSSAESFLLLLAGVSGVFYLLV